MYTIDSAFHRARSFARGQQQIRHYPISPNVYQTFHGSLRGLSGPSPQPQMNQQITPKPPAHEDRVLPGPITPGSEQHMARPQFARPNSALRLGAFA